MPIETKDKVMVSIILILVAISVLSLTSSKSENRPDIDRVNSLVKAQERELEKIKKVRDSLQYNKSLYIGKLDSLTKIIKNKSHSEEDVLKWIEKYNSELH